MVALPLLASLYHIQGPQELEVHNGSTKSEHEAVSVATCGEGLRLRDPLPLGEGQRYDDALSHKAAPIRDIYLRMTVLTPLLEWIREA